MNIKHNIPKYRYLISVLLLSLLLLSCQKESAQSPSGEPGAAAEDAAFEFPEETNKLVVYNSHIVPMTGPEAALLPAIDIFEKLYPDVEVEIKYFSNNELVQIMRTEIPAGTGPDLLFCHINYFPDIEKTKAAHVFIDLNPYIENDDDFDMDNYIGHVADIGVHDGQQLLLPFGHRIPVLFTTQELLDEVGIDAAMFETLDGFIEACTIFHERYPGVNFFEDTGTLDSNVNNLEFLYRFGDYRLLDYEGDGSSANLTAFRKMVDLCNLFYRDSPYEDGLEKYDWEYNSWQSLLNRECLFTDMAWSKGGVGVMSVIADNVKKEQTPVMFLLPGADDKPVSTLDVFGAIPYGAENKLNAWRLMKILLSDEIQGDSVYMYSYLPVMKSAVPMYWTSSAAYAHIFRKYGYQDAVEQMLLSIDRTSVLVPTVKEYLHEAMDPYLSGKQPYEKCLEKLMNVLTLYRDE